MASLPRWVHRMYASLLRYYRLPCPSCGREFDGHEYREIAGHFAAIPDAGDRWTAHHICPTCTAAGVGCRANAKRGMWHAGCCYVGPIRDFTESAEYFRNRHLLSDSERVNIVGPDSSSGSWMTDHA